MGDRGMILRHGVHAPLEEVANEMLRVSMAMTTKHSDKSDVLTPWKEQARKSREVMVPSGTPDSSLRRGMFHRSLNTAAPHLNSVSDGSRTSRRITTPNWDSE